MKATNFLKMCLILFVFKLLIFIQSSNISAQFVQPENLSTTTAQNHQMFNNCGEIGKNGNYKYVISKGIKNFINELNKAAGCGYKLEKLTKVPLNASERYDEMILAGILTKLDADDKYEYDWFESFIPGDVVTKINLRAKEGFYFKDIIPVVQGLCGDVTRYSPDKSETEKLGDVIINSLYFAEGNIYFLEKRANNKEQKEYRVNIGTMGRGNKAAEELQKSLADSHRRGFQPVAMGTFKFLNRYALSLLMERNKEEEAVDNGNDNKSFQIINSEFNFEKKVNNLAKTNYTLVFSGKFGAFSYALMQKTDQSNSQGTYTWVDSIKKSYLEKISKLSEEGLAYHTVAKDYYSCDTAEIKLIFKSKMNRAGEKVEHKMLKLWDINKISGKEEIELDKLVNSGFTIRDLFFADGIYVLFERVK